VRRSWQHYAAPAAFLLAVTIAVVLVRAGFESGGSSTDSDAPGTVAATTGSTSTRTRPAARFWVVKAGDTFAVISTATGVSVKRIQKLNPKLRSTTLFIGEKVRIR
jgi:LysM repeat protein